MKIRPLGAEFFKKIGRQGEVNYRCSKLCDRTQKVEVCQAMKRFCSII
jgi:hypothetical protein